MMKSQARLRSDTDLKYGKEKETMLLYTPDCHLGCDRGKCLHFDWLHSHCRNRVSRHIRRLHFLTSRTGKRDVKYHSHFNGIV